MFFFYKTIVFPMGINIYVEIYFQRNLFSKGKYLTCQVWRSGNCLSNGIVDFLLKTATVKNISDITVLKKDMNMIS